MSVIAPPSTRLLRVPEAAIDMRVTRQHVYRLIRAGRLRAVHVGSGNRDVRIAVSDLEAFYRGGTSDTLGEK